MATIQYTAIVNDIRGSIAGSTFSRNANGSYIKSKANPINPDTPDQRLVRAQFTDVTRGWSLLTDGDREAWRQKAATEWSYQNRLGESRQYTGFQLYQKLNMQLVTLGLPAITSPPSPAKIEYIQPDTLTATLAADGSWSVFSYELAAEVPVSQTLVLTAGGTCSAGSQNPDCFSRKKSSNNGYAGGTDTVDLIADYQAIYGTPSAGQTIGIGAYLVDNDTGTRLDLPVTKAVVTQLP